MGGAGFEPAKVEPPDLQSGPFSHLGIHPNNFGRAFRRGSSFDPSLPDFLKHSSAGPGIRLKAGGESRTHNRRFTKPVLCRLSYASRHEAVKAPFIPSGSPNARAFQRSWPKSRRKIGPGCRKITRRQRNATAIVTRILDPSSQRGRAIALSARHDCNRIGSRSARGCRDFLRSRPHFQRMRRSSRENAPQSGVTSNCGAL